MTSRLPHVTRAQVIDGWKTASPLRKIERKGESNLVGRSKKTTKSLIGRVDPNGFAALLGTDVDEEDLAGVGSGDASVGDAPPSSSTPSARTALPVQRALLVTDPRPHCSQGAVQETEPTSTRSGFRFGKFCSTKLLCIFFSVVIGLGCSAFALSSYGSDGVSELLGAVSVPDAVAIPVSNRTGAQWLPARPDSPSRVRSCIAQVLDLSNTTPKNEFSPFAAPPSASPSSPPALSIWGCCARRLRGMQSSGGSGLLACGNTTTVKGAVTTNGKTTGWGKRSRDFRPQESRK